ncbi:hypothetical protein LCGC14_2531270 [marine sediment metagenome]|uniref:Carbohydrate-binding module family 96 domain-containing protein n=1 Tax=marine sediment metagenome TaxID=412755 RepID=A0A0F9BGB9_9ZZZZ
MILIVINLIFFLIPTRAITETKKFIAIADAWIDGESPSTNYGNDPELKVGWANAEWKQALIRFDLSSKPANYYKAEIQFYCTLEDIFQLTIEVEELVGGYEWNENTVTWNSRPDLFDGWSITFITVSNNGFYKIDITDKFLFEDYDIWITPTETESILIASREDSPRSPRIVFFIEGSDLAIIPHKSQDLIYTNNVFNLLPNKNKFIRDSYQTLKAGGYLIIADEFSKVALPSEIDSDPAFRCGGISGAQSKDFIANICTNEGFKQKDFQIINQYEIEYNKVKFPLETGILVLQKQY